MLRYLVVFITTISLLCFLFFAYRTKDINLVTEKFLVECAKNIAELFQETIWDKYSFFLENYEDDLNQHQFTSQYLNFKNDSRLFFSSLGVLQAEISLDDGPKVFCLNDYLEHKHGASYHNFNGKDTVYFFDNKDNIVIKTPILSDGKLSAVLEITYKIDDDLYKISLNWIVCGFFVLLIFCIFSFYAFIKLQNGSKILNEQFLINQKLKLAKANVEDLSLKKSQFLANVSHELKTPLNAIIGFSDLIRACEEANEKHKSYANDIYNAGNHLLNLINDILDFSKSELNKLKIKSSLFDLVKLIETCIRMTTADAKDIKIEKDLFQEKIVIKADHKRLKQVFLNILSNSVKFTDKNGLIKISVTKPSKDLIIKISDNGIGIPEKDLAKALSAFGQSSSELSRKYEGTGIGLPFSKNLIELMGGKFEIESTQGKGTEVAIYLPFTES